MRHTKRQIKNKPRAIAYIFLVVLIGIIFYTHYYAILVIAAFILFLFLGNKWSNRTKELSSDETYILCLPKYGYGNQGMTTSEFADECGLSFNDARYILDKYRKRGRVTHRMSGSKWRWYLR